MGFADFFEFCRRMTWLWLIQIPKRSLHKRFNIYRKNMKTMEQLSTGKRINSAGDDAAVGHINSNDSANSGTNKQ